MASILASQPESPRQIMPPMIPPTPDGRVRFHRDAYHRLFEAGILPSDIRVELIGGEIYMMSPIGPQQGGLTTRVTGRLV